MNLVVALLGLTIAFCFFVLFCCVKQTGFFKAFKQIAFNGVRVVQRRNSQGKDSNTDSQNSQNASVPSTEPERPTIDPGDSINGGSTPIQFIKNERSAPILDHCQPEVEQPSTEVSSSTQAVPQ